MIRAVGNTFTIRARTASASISGGTNAFAQGRSAPSGARSKSDCKIEGVAPVTPHPTRGNKISPASAQKATTDHGGAFPTASSRNAKSATAASTGAWIALRSHGGVEGGEQ